MTGVSLRKIQAWAGHSDPRITEQYDAHLLPEYDPEIERIEAGGYNLVTIEAKPEKAKTRYLL